ncbi:hypothetical protein [Ruegeria arenilitoris]|uniref:hypothetical protein n=1 Tax=Ruegeria arenilitoris TaxID=1173585 RepID=UPI00147FB0C7|nr:hypothetical protein [Ruegeria arenilitoris]
MSIFRQPWPAQVGLVIQAGITLPLAVVFSAIPAFVLRMIAVIFHLLHPITAGVCGAVTGAAVYLLLNTENMTGRPLVVDLHGLLLFSVAGAIAGLVWLWVERLGTNKE